MPILTSSNLTVLALAAMLVVPSLALAGDCPIFVVGDWGIGEIDGRIMFYLGEGRYLDTPVPALPHGPRWDALYSALPLNPFVLPPWTRPLLLIAPAIFMATALTRGLGRRRYGWSLRRGRSSARNSNGAWYHQGMVFAVLTASLLGGCGQPALVLSEDAAMERLMSTKRAASLMRAIPHRRLTCRVEDETPDAIDLYLGDDEGTHTKRIGFYRVTRDGRVWGNTDETGIEDRWVTIE